MKKILSAVLLVCVIAVALCACQPKENITPDEAVQVVMEDLGILVNNASAPHVHEGTYEGEPCYNVYVTVGAASLVYVVSMQGKILHQGTGSHSH